MLNLFVCLFICRLYLKCCISLAKPTTTLSLLLWLFFLSKKTYLNYLNNNSNCLHLHFDLMLSCIISLSPRINMFYLVVLSYGWTRSVNSSTGWREEQTGCILWTKFEKCKYLILFFLLFFSQSVLVFCIYTLLHTGNKRLFFL